ncbi:MAG: trimeric intracellular cation channel family protein [Desulfuromonadales bacterium]
MNLLYLLDLAGTAAFAASGAWAGIRRRMDLFGVLVLGLVTATGGGTMRDALLGTRPFIFQDETYLYVSLAVALTIFFFHRQLMFLHHPLLYFDAVGLGTFVVIGTGKAIAFEAGFLGAVIIGVMTATAGGVLRDVLSGEVPLVLRREIYASACLVGAALLYLLLHWGVPRNPALLAAALSVIALRLLAIRFNWSLPKAR